jgi:hypothetical protein
MFNYDNAKRDKDILYRATYGNGTNRSKKMVSRIKTGTGKRYQNFLVIYDRPNWFVSIV